jgi:hypothetical protein
LLPSEKINVVSQQAPPLSVQQTVNRKSLSKARGILADSRCAPITCGADTGETATECAIGLLAFWLIVEAASLQPLLVTHAFAKRFQIDCYYHNRSANLYCRRRGISQIRRGQFGLDFCLRILS